MSCEVVLTSYVNEVNRSVGRIVVYTFRIGLATDVYSLHLIFVIQRFVAVASLGIVRM